MIFRPKHPKWDQNQQFTPLSETTSISVTSSLYGSPPWGLCASEWIVFIWVWLKRSLLPGSAAKTGDDTSRARDMNRPHGWLLIGRSGVNGFKMNFSDLELTRSAKMDEGKMESDEDFLPYLADVHTKNKTALELII